ncbi:MAG: flagellar basal body L-ring protein FlgH [Phycisphaerales bacterium]
MRARHWPCAVLALAVPAGALAQQTLPPTGPARPGPAAPQPPAPVNPAPVAPPAGESLPAPARHAQPPGAASPGETSTPLYGYSLLVVAPPRPRTYAKHDLVAIIVDESSRQQADQTLNTDKKYNNASTLNTIIDPWELLELRLRGGDLSKLQLLGIDSKAKFDGKGRYERSDRLQLKIEAEIIDVKPNGVLTLEAKKVIDKNGELTTTVLSGSCRPEDITANNSVFSSQLASMTLITRNEGQVNEAGKKGLVPRVLETLFAF